MEVRRRMYIHDSYFHPRLLVARLRQLLTFLFTRTLEVSKPLGLRPKAMCANLKHQFCTVVGGPYNEWIGPPARLTVRPK